MTVYRNEKKSESGTSLNRNLVCSGRPRSGRSEENIQNVQLLLVNNPRGVSSRRMVWGFPPQRFIVFVKKHPYKICVRHELKPGEVIDRSYYCFER